MARILVVDDEEYIQELLKFNLEKEGFEVVLAGNGGQALDLTQKLLPDLIVLDIMLPGMDGLEVCKLIRQNPEFSSTPVIMLTARGEELDKVLGLELGADDYLTKPFSPRELVARVKARLRRHGGNPQNQNRIVIGNLIIDTDSFRVIADGRSLDLTPKELELLKFLASNPGKVFSRDYLLEKIWGYDFAGDTRTVDVHIRHLRQKIEVDPANPLYIETLRGVGYRFKLVSQHA
ncbi:MAG TPA: response regulator transcription factor [Candidatus Deferrimicrobium sp.]|nr:response regulator transcription factor [Candidatus Deferrimicrobium sp.]